GLLALIGSGCGRGGLTNQPLAVTSFPYGTDVVVNAQFLVDVSASGCDSGYETIQILQDGKEVGRTNTPRAGGNRLTVSTSELDLRGLSYPLALSLSARLTCAGGSSIESASATMKLLPAAQRFGQEDTRWPGYQFLVEDGGTFLFCKESSLIRM